MAIPRLVVHVSAASATGLTTTGVDTTGAVFLAAVVCNATGATANTLTDSNSNTWNGLTAQSITSPQRRLRIFYAVNPTVGAAHTFTLSTVAGSSPTIAVLAFAGIATTSPFDVENGATATGAASSMQAGSITPTQDNALIVVGFATGSSVAPAGVDGICITTDDGPDTGRAGYGVQSSAAAINPTWTWSGGTGSNRLAVIASFLTTPAPTALSYGFFLD